MNERSGKKKVLEGEILPKGSAAGSSGTHPGAGRARPNNGNAPGRRRLLWGLGLVAAVFLLGLLARPALEGGLAGMLPSYFPKAADEIPVGEIPAAAPVGELEGLRTAVGDLERKVAALAAGGGDIQVIEAAKKRALQDIDSRLEELKKTGGPISGVSRAEIEELAAAISGAGERLTALEEKLANGAPLAGPASGPADPALTRALKDSIEELATRLAGIEKQQLTAAKSGSIGLAASLLAEKARSGRSFRVELLSVEVLSEALMPTEKRTVSDLLARLSPFARKGVASIPELGKSFTPLIKSALKAAGVPVDGDWLQNSWAEVRGLIVIRRTGNVEGDTVAARLARAEYKLGEEDLAGAMVEVKALEAKSREVFKAWLEVAVTHTMVSKTAAELEGFLELDSGGRE